MTLKERFGQSVVECTVEEEEDEEEKEERVMD